MRDLVMHDSGATIDLSAPTAEHQTLLRAMLMRESRPRTRRGELRCAEHGGALYLQVRDGEVHACHWAGSGLSPHRVALMSTEHRMQVEYVARAADRAGLEASPEVTLPTRVRPDLVIGTDTAIEVQRSHLTVGQAKSRTTKAIHGGMTISLWISDKEPKYAPKWMYTVPSATIFARDWDTVPAPGSATVTGGLRRVVEQPCRPPHHTQCPETGRRWCGGWHLGHEPMLGVSLDALTVGVAQGEYVPAAISGRVLLATRSQVDRYEIAWSPPLRASRSTTRRYGERIECRTTVPDLAAAVCCGEKPVGIAGKPLVPSCQLCTNSPTYWRLPNRQTITEDN